MESWRRRPCHEPDSRFHADGGRGPATHEGRECAIRRRHPAIPHRAEGNPRRSRQEPASLRHHLELQRLGSARADFRFRFGALFVVRVAGNVLSSEGAGSLQYAGRHLHTPLFVVLGHTNCGAVAAAIDTRLRGTRQLSRVQVLVDSILPSLADLDSQLSPEAMLAQAVEANVRWSMRQILETPEGRERQAEGRVKLVGAIYEIKTGRVRLLE
jgi:hypothetical protein